MVSDNHAEQCSSRKPSYLHLKRGIKTTYLSAFLHLSCHRILFGCLIFFLKIPFPTSDLLSRNVLKKKLEILYFQSQIQPLNLSQQRKVVFFPPPLQYPIQSSLTYGKTVQCFQGWGIFQKAEGTLSVFLCCNGKEQITQGTQNSQIHESESTLGDAWGQVLGKEN